MIAIKNIACAAWMLWKGENFIRFNDRNEFIFESKGSSTDWNNEYIKTDFAAVDSKLLLLRNLMRQERR